MDEETRTLAKLSPEARALWDDTRQLYRTPSAMARPEPFNGLRSRLARLPRNQRRYYRQLMRLNAERFYRADLLTLEPEEFGEMIEDKGPEELLFVVEQLRIALAEHMENS